MSFSEKFITIFKKVLPSPFTIAILLTILTFILALFFTLPSDKSIGKYSVDLLKYWEEGLWNKTDGGIYFAFQMMFMLVLGHVLALSKPVSNFINKMTKYCTTTANTAFIVSFLTILVSFFNWGLGLIFGAILTRKIGEKFNLQKKQLNYGLIGASAYVGLMVWHGGISGSAPIKAAENNHLKSMAEGVSTIKLETIPEQIPFESSVFSSMNIFVSILLIVILPLSLYLIGKKVTKDAAILPKSYETKKEEDNNITSGAEKLDYSSIFGTSIGICIILYLIVKIFFLSNTFNLNFINPNFINLLLLALALILHQKIKSFIQSVAYAISDGAGILIQFPIYFGILGIMTGSGLINLISNYFIQISTETTLPIYTFLSAGVINFFVPSGGAQWAVQGPIVISAAQNIGVPYPKVIMALAYGDQLTNMLQPFWALPLLGITGLKAKEILPYTFVLFLIGSLIFLAGLLIF